MANTEVSIIIVTWNTAEITHKCVQTINHFLSSKIDFEIIVADNGSQDKTQELISHLPRVVYFNTHTNLGFSKANNLAAAKASGKYLFFLNSDMELVDDKLIDMLQYLKHHPSIGIIAPRFLDPDLSIQGSVFPPQTPLNAFRQYFLNQSAYSKYYPLTDQATTVWAVSGGAILISRHLFDQIGGWNDRYFMYFEDLDLCRQVRRLGLDIIYFPQFNVIHRHGSSGKNITDPQNQWRRLIPGSIRYHGYLLHTAINFIIWSGQKWQKIQQKLTGR